MTLNDIFRWWCGEMAGLLPLRRRQGAADAFVLAFDGAQLRLSHRRGPVLRDLGRFPPEPRQGAQARRRIGRGMAGLLVMVEPQHLLERSIVLPLAAQPDPAAVLRYDLDRLTPFEPDEICWGYEITERDQVRQQMSLRLSLVPRAAVQDTLRLLERIGLPPAGLTLRGPDGGWRDIPLAGTPARHDGFDRAALRVAATACALAAVAALAMPVVRTEMRLAEAEAMIAQLRPAIDQIDTMRRGLAAAQAEAAARLDTGGAGGGPLGALATLTGVLPDDTFLTEFSLANGRLLLRGQSANAARLIGLLSANANLHAVAFAAPITRALGDTADSFAIQAELAGRR